jgi:hypothetical protein
LAGRHKQAGNRVAKLLGENSYSGFVRLSSCRNNLIEDKSGAFTAAYRTNPARSVEKQLPFTQHLSLSGAKFQLLADLLLLPSCKTARVAAV